MTLSFYFISGGLGTCGAQTVSSITNLTGRLGKPFLHPVQDPFGVLRVNTFLICSISFWSSSGLLQTAFTL